MNDDREKSGGLTADFIVLGVAPDRRDDPLGFTDFDRTVCSDDWVKQRFVAHFTRAKQDQ